MEGTHFEVDGNVIEKRGNGVFYNNVILDVAEEIKFLDYTFTHPISLRKRNYRITTFKYTNQFSLQNKESGKEFFIHIPDSELKYRFPEHNFNIFISNNNIIIILSFEDTIKIIRFKPFVDYIYENIYRIEYFRNYYAPDIFKEMLQSKKTLNYPENDIKIDGDCLVRFSDGVMTIPKKDLISLRSEYINNLLENMKEDEILEEFSDIKSSKFKFCFYGVWRANESKIVNKLSKINSIIFNHKCRQIKGFLYCQQNMSIEQILSILF